MIGLPPREDPAVREDGCCVVCDKPRPSRRGRPPVENVGTRLDRNVWLFHVDRDPFCSMNCARSYYGAPLPDRVNAEHGECVDCNAPLSIHRARLYTYRCRECAKVHARKRKYTTPGHCAGCGIAHAEPTGTSGCAICSDRIRSKARRQNNPASSLAYEAKRKAKRQQLREAA